MLSKWPFFGGLYTHGVNGGRGTLKYPKRGGANVDFISKQVFDWRDRSDKGWTYDDFKATRAPPRTLTQKTFCNVPDETPGPGKSVYPLTLRATFIKGGLVLGFLAHHGIVDGGGLMQVLECFAGSSGEHEIDDEADEASLVTLLRTKKQVTKRIEALGPVSDARFISTNDTYNFAGMAPPEPMPNPHPAQGLFIFDAGVVDSIRDMFLDELRPKHGPDVFISAVDVICGFIWVFVTRARRYQLHDYVGSAFAMAVDVRSRVLKNNEAADYVGNMFIRVLAHASVKELAPRHDSRKGLYALAPTMADAALRIRRAIQTLDDPAKLAAHFAVASEAVLMPSMIDSAVRRCTDRDLAGLDCSVGANFVADLDYHIPGTQASGGKPTFSRRPWTPHAGVVRFMPRSGGTKGDADWEVVIALPEDQIVHLAGPDELGMIAELVDYYD